jgi:DNA polymerase III subunit gamma/tau
MRYAENERPKSRLFISLYNVPSGEAYSREQPLEPFIVSARKYRPQTFEDVVGQQAITRTLLNAIENSHLAQALLFCGPRGVGKTTCARILAKKINEDTSEKQDEDFAFNIFELDAASNNSVDDIRNLIDQVRIPPQVGKYKVYIIDEVHMLSQAAFNAFLKTLEEPPRHAIFILATTEKRKIIPTILSRCQIFDFRRITVKDAAAYLKTIALQQEIKVEDEALHLIAQKADGAMRDALSIFDRVVSFSGSTLTLKAVTENLNVLDRDTFFKATDLILEYDIPGLLLLFNEILSRGFEGHHFISGLASHFRDLMVCRHEDTIELLEVSENAKGKFLEQSRRTDEGFLLKAIDISNECDLKYKSSKNHRLLVELSLMKLASINFNSEKKNPDASIEDAFDLIRLVPASYFREKNAAPAFPDENGFTIPRDKQPSGPEPERVERTYEEAGHDPGRVINESAAVAVEEPSQKIRIKERSKHVSGLSLSSLKAKKAHNSRKQTTVEEKDLPSQEFTEEDMRGHWAAFVILLDAEGRKILASSLNTELPTLLPDHTIGLELPNSTMKKEVEREQGELLSYLRKHLHNHRIQLKISVNEETAKRFVYTPAEKYEKLREKNPAIDLLKQEFDLEL